MAFERINDNGNHPNPLISFVTPLRERRSNSDIERSQLILNRIAAVVYPIMKTNGLKVTSLNEYEYNTEFAGRNWNAGEVIELVLRNKDGSWFHEVWILQVMLHELSHITNMHHGKTFWATLTKYKKDMKVLLESGYTGEGFYSHGRSLLHETLISPNMFLFHDFPSNICGGTFKRKRSKGKRKAPDDDNVLGGDLEYREELEGQAVGSKPRVAQSKRGLNLRLAAAEKRLEAERMLIEDFESISNTFDEADDETREQMRKEREDIGGECRTIINVDLTDDLLPEIQCNVCTAKNISENINCEVCGNLLKIFHENEIWICKSLTCKDYLNHIDSYHCGICGSKRRNEET